MKRILPFLIIALLLLSSPLHAQAQQTPAAPPPIANLTLEGAQNQYLGEALGFDGWLSLKNGQPQYFYVPKGGQGFVMGLLFDNQGKAITFEQLQTLQAQNNPALDALSGFDVPESPTDIDPSLLSPAERLLAEVEASNCR